MTLLPQWWRAHFLKAEFGIAAVGTLAFVFWVQCRGGAIHVDEILTHDHGVVYGTLASICASLLGFTIASTSIVLVSASTPRLRIVRNSRHYQVMWSVFRAAIRALALGTVLALVALVVGRDGVLSDPVLFFLVFAVLLSCLRIARTIWVLEKIIAIVAAPRGGNGGS